MGGEPSLSANTKCENRKRFGKYNTKCIILPEFALVYCV